MSFYRGLLASLACATLLATLPPTVHAAAPSGRRPPAPFQLPPGVTIPPGGLYVQPNANRFNGLSNVVNDQLQSARVPRADVLAAKSALEQQGVVFPKVPRSVNTDDFFVPPEQVPQFQDALGQAQQAREAQEAAKNKGKPTWIDYIGSFFLAIIYYLLVLIMWVLGLILSIAGMFTDFILSMTRLAGAPVIQEGWRFTRDALNFVFILGLLAIAFSTIAGIESYGMRQLLPRLLTAALLVNFSLAIAGVFLQVANVLKDTAIAGIPDRLKCQQALVAGSPGGSGSEITCALAKAASISDQFEFGPSDFLESLGLPNIATFGKNAASPTAFSIKEHTFLGNVGAVVSAAIAVLFIAFFCAAMMVLAAMLGVRVAMLALLLVLAPAPYVFSIVPRASQWGEKWWSTFIQYTAFLPAIVFFLVLAVRMADVAQGGIAQKQFLADPSVFGPFGGQVLLKMFDAFFVSAFILVSIFVAKTLGIYGAQAAIGFARRTVTGAVRGTARAGWAVGGYPLRVARRAAAVGAGKAVEGVGTAIGKTGPGGKALETFRRPSLARQIFTGKAVKDQQEAQKKAIEGLDERGLKAAMARGNAAAGAKLAEDGDLDTPQDYERAVRMQPVNTEQRQKVGKAYEKRFPIQAILKDRASAILAGTQRATAEQTEKLKKAFSKIKSEDYVKLKGDDVRTAFKAGVAMPISRGQLQGVFDSSNADLQDAAQEYIEGLRKTAAAPRVKLKPGPQALLKYATDRLSI